MSESKFCILCHETVWFGAYGTSKEHIIFKLNPSYETESRVCHECKAILDKLPMQKEGEY